MRILTIVLALLSVAATALADPTDLSGGVLITHFPPNLMYCYGGDLCTDAYDLHYGINDASEQNNSIQDHGDAGLPLTWYVVAAFNEEKEWCGTEFGLGDYNPYVFYMTNSGYACLQDCLEIPTSSWPGPNSGTSIVGTTTPWSGNYRPVYVFQGYTYLASTGDFTPTIIEVTENPAQNFMGFGNCEVPAEVWTAEGGGLGVWTEGIYVEPSIPVACCFEDGHCEIIMPFDCSGTVYPDSQCDPNPCPLPIRACCIGDLCTLTIEADCDGVWLADTDACEPNPCLGGPSPVENDTWGDIKVLYR
jgi:hypothetical protein